MAWRLTAQSWTANDACHKDWADRRTSAATCHEELDLLIKVGRRTDYLTTRPKTYLAGIVRLRRHAAERVSLLTRCGANRINRYSHVWGVQHWVK